MEYKKIIYSILLLCGFGSCLIPERESCPPDEYYFDSIPLWEKALIPYKGYDTLIFVNSTKGDTHTYIGTGVIQYFNSETFPLNIDCPGGHAELETYGFEFKSNTSESRLIVKEIVQSHNGLKFFTIQFTPSTYETTLGTIQSNFYAFDSVAILNQYYYKIKKIALVDYQGSSENFLLYNTQFGILSLITRYGEKWELISKK